MISYRSAFAVGGSPPTQETLKKISLPSGYAGGPTIFLLPPMWEREVHLSNEPIPQVSSQECDQALDTDNATLSAPTVDHEY